VDRPFATDRWSELVHRQQESEDIPFSTSHQKSLAEYRAAVRLATARLVADPVIRMRVTPSGLLSWLNDDDGLYRTRFEVGDTRGDWYEEQRLMTEEIVLGVPRDTSPDDRPRYGYLADAEGSEHLDGYGLVVVTLSQIDSDSVTVVLGDSLSSTNAGGYACFAPEGLTSTELACRCSHRDVLRHTTLTLASDPCVGYTEVQMYCAITPNNILRVDFFHGEKANVELRDAMSSYALDPFEHPGPPV
jgi:hypothetical protein